MISVSFSLALHQLWAMIQSLHHNNWDLSSINAPANDIHVLSCWYVGYAFCLPLVGLAPVTLSWLSQRDLRLFWPPPFYCLFTAGRESYWRSASVRIFALRINHSEDVFPACGQSVTLDKEECLSPCASQMAPCSLYSALLLTRALWHTMV